MGNGVAVKFVKKWNPHPDYPEWIMYEDADGTKWDVQNPFARFHFNRNCMTQEMIKEKTNLLHWHADEIFPIGSKFVGFDGVEYIRYGEFIIEQEGFWDIRVYVEGREDPVLIRQNGKTAKKVCT